MKYLWSPWRMKYILEHERSAACIFCEAVKRDADEESLVLYRGQHNFIILNRYPYTSGHLMVVPNDHQAELHALSTETRSEMMELMVRVECLLKKVYDPEGFNLGANIGSAAGAGIASHLHFHVVPRWDGDTNFMSTLASTRVLPEALGETYRRLLDAWEMKID